MRLFQRKYKWIQNSNMNYENISSNLEPYLEELRGNSFLIDESSIESYDEIIDLLKLPQLKQIFKQFHVVSPKNMTRRIDYVNAILKHFKTQKRINFNKAALVDAIENAANSKYMIYCKNLLGKSFKLNKNIRDVFVRILMLFSLSSTQHMDQHNVDSGQQPL